MCIQWSNILMRQPPWTYWNLGKGGGGVIKTNMPYCDSHTFWVGFEKSPNTVKQKTTTAMLRGHRILSTESWEVYKVCRVTHLSNKWTNARNVSFTLHHRQLAYPLKLLVEQPHKPTLVLQGLGSHSKIERPPFYFGPPKWLSME